MKRGRTKPTTEPPRTFKSVEEFREVIAEGWGQEVADATKITRVDDDKDENKKQTDE